MDKNIRLIFVVKIDIDYPVTLQAEENSASEKPEKHHVHSKPRKLYSWELSKEPLDVRLLIR